MVYCFVTLSICATYIMWTFVLHDAYTLGMGATILANTQNISPYFYANSNYFETYCSRFIKYVFYLYAEFNIRPMRIQRFKNMML